MRRNPLSLLYLIGRIAKSFRNGLTCITAIHPQNSQLTLCFRFSRNTTFQHERQVFKVQPLLHFFRTTIAMADIIDDLEQWLDNAFGPLDASPRFTELDVTEDDASPDIGLTITDKPMAVHEQPPTAMEPFPGNSFEATDSTGSLLASQATLSGELTLTKRRYYVRVYVVLCINCKNTAFA